MVIYKNKLEITGSGGVLHLQWLSNKPHGTQLKLLLSRKIKNTIKSNQQNIIKNNYQR